jgi:adenylyltransferase/sulfurtransferase
MELAQITCAELKAKLDRGEAIYLIDVRQPWEHDLAALPDQLLIPVDQLADRLDEVAPPPGAQVVTYCHHGIRSLHAAALLARAGVRAASLHGGIDQWSQAIDPRVPRY